MFKNGLLIFLIFCCCHAVAENYVKTSRYVESKLSASEAQIEPLKAIVRIKFPHTLRTVKDGIDYVLDDSGYELIQEELWTNEMRIILSARISHIQRDLTSTPLTLIDVIDLLVGEALFPVSDPLRRKVSVHIKEQYKGVLIDG